MQGLQKTKCASCGVMFMSEGAKKCPSCASSHGGGHDMGGCGCGHHH